MCTLNVWGLVADVSHSWVPFFFVSCPGAKAICHFQVGFALHRCAERLRVCICGFLVLEVCWHISEGLLKSCENLYWISQASSVRQTLSLCSSTAVEGLTVYNDIFCSASAALLGSFDHSRTDMHDGLLQDPTRQQSSTDVV
jgi:hypothetical protein